MSSFCQPRLTVDLKVYVVGVRDGEWGLSTAKGSNRQTVGLMDPTVFNICPRRFVPPAIFFVIEMCLRH